MTDLASTPSPSRRVPRCRPTLVANTSLVYRPNTQGREVPGFAGGGLTRNLFDDGQLPFDVEADLDCQWDLSESVALTAHVDAGYGSTWLQTLASDDHPSPTALHGFGFSDASVGARIRVADGYTLVPSIGRQSSTMGFQGVSPRLNFIRPWAPSFLVSPFSDTGLRLTLETPATTLSAGLSAGPDRLPWTDNNASVWGSLFFKWKINAAWTLTTNYQLGPDQDADDRRLTHIVDLGLAWNISDTAMLGIYGLFGSQITANSTTHQDEERYWGAVETYFRVRVAETPIGFTGLFGYFSDSGARTSTLRRTARGFVPNNSVGMLHGTLGFDIHINETQIPQRDGTETTIDRVLFRADAGLMQCVSATCGFPSGATMITLGGQLVLQWVE